MRTSTSPARGPSSASSSMASGAPISCRTAARISALLQLVAQGLADPAALEGERVRERQQLVVAQAPEQLGVLRHERLRQREVEHERAHEVEAAPRIRVEGRRLAGHEVLDGLRDLRVLTA